jgi:hypothetical protein
MNKFIQTIILINQKGRGWKTASKQLTNILKYFLKKEGFF